MKKLSSILSVTALSLSSLTFGQNIAAKEVPQVVADKLQKDFPAAKDVEWKKDGENYKADFDISNKDVDVWYNSKGQFVKKESELVQTDLPKVVQDLLTGEYKDFKVDGVKKIVVGNAVTYQVELDSAKQDWKVTFDKNGKVLSKIAD